MLGFKRFHKRRSSLGGIELEEKLKKGQFKTRNSRSGKEVCRTVECSATP